MFHLGHVVVKSSYPSVEFFFHAQTLQIPYHITVSVQSQPNYHQTSPHVWLKLSRDLPPGGKTKVQWVGQCRYTRVTSQQQLLQSKQFSIFQNQTSASASLWNFLCVFVLNYFSTFPEVFPVMRCLLKTKKGPRGGFVPCYAKLCQIPKLHFLVLSEFNHEPSSSTSRRTTRSISATSWESCSLRNVLKRQTNVTEREELCVNLDVDWGQISRVKHSNTNMR